MSEIIIPDEWFIHDLKGDNGEERQSETFSFMEKVFEKCDRLAVIVGGSFMNKFNNLLMSDSRLKISLSSRYLNLAFFINPSKSIKLTIVQELNEEIKNQIPIGKEYLYQIYQTLGEGKIITTTKDLENIPNTYFRDEFLSDYNCAHGR